MNDFFVLLLKNHSLLTCTSAVTGHPLFYLATLGPVHSGAGSNMTSGEKAQLQFLPLTTGGQRRPEKAGSPRCSGEKTRSPIYSELPFSPLLIPCALGHLPLPLSILLPSHHTHHFPQSCHSPMDSSLLTPACPGP